MPKRGHRKGKSDAWKNLVRVVKRGPKRVKMNRRRSRNGVNPLSDPKATKRIQIVQTGLYERRLGVAVLNSVFDRMNLEDGGEYSMHRGELTRAARLLKKAINLFGHNDFVLGDRMVELKLDNFVGKCVVLTGDIKNPNATLIIRPKKIEQDQRDKVSEHISALFSADSGVMQPRRGVTRQTYDSDSSDGGSD